MVVTTNMTHVGQTCVTIRTGWQTLNVYFTEGAEKEGEKMIATAEDRKREMWDQLEVAAVSLNRMAETGKEHGADPALKATMQALVDVMRALSFVANVAAR